MILPVTNIQRFSTKDGKGIRTVVFLKGCPLKCWWCHNPETQNNKQEILFKESKCLKCGKCFKTCEKKVHNIINGEHIIDRSKCVYCGQCIKYCPANALEFAYKDMTLQDIITECLKDKAFYGKDGGVTISGGEPMMHPEETINLLKMFKQNGINTVIETCGFFNKKYVEDLCAYTDCFLWDFKDGNTERHLNNTGLGNVKIINNLLSLDKKAKMIILRCLMIKEINMDFENLDKLIEIYHKLNNCIGVELLKYHCMADYKYKELNLINKNDRKYIPDNKYLKQVKVYLKEKGLKIINNN